MEKRIAEQLRQRRQRIENAIAETFEPNIPGDFTVEEQD